MKLLQLFPPLTERVPAPMRVTAGADPEIQISFWREQRQLAPMQDAATTREQGDHRFRAHEQGERTHGRERLAGLSPEGRVLGIVDPLHDSLVPDGRGLHALGLASWRFCPSRPGYFSNGWQGVDPDGASAFQ